MSTTLRIKPGLRWFPAGTEWETLLVQLSDGAFKLFVYLSCNAERDTGQLKFQQTALARALHKSRRSIGVYLQELEDRHVCTVTLGRNQYAGGVIRIDPCYWPYESAQPEPTRNSQERNTYVHSVQRFLQSCSCVRGRFSAMDRQLAEKWFHQGVELGRVEEAILLGCGRKYVSWFNNGASEPITSLRYFESLIADIQAQPLPPGYVDYMRDKNERLVKAWDESVRSGKTNSNRGCSDMATSEIVPL
jgi:hypothetical protein